MTKLREIRQQIGRLHRMRRNARHGTGWCGAALAVLWLAAALLLIDYPLELGRFSRFLLLCAAGGVLYWSIRKFTLPWFQQKETEIDVALIVERRQQIDSDLVAALQFEGPDARSWGSPQLEAAVVDYVADFGRGWNVLEGFTRAQLSRRATLLAITAAAWLLFTLVAFDVAWAFVRRMAFLSRVHYPTATQSESIEVNGTPVEWLPEGQATAKCPYGDPLRFRISCRGELPAAGVATLRGGGLTTTIDLVRAPDKATPPGAEADKTPSTAGVAIYIGELPRAVDDLVGQIYLGDAWTDPALLAVIPLPNIELDVKPTPPEYARGDEESSDKASNRQVSVIEGSRVDLAVRCTNKGLKEARLYLDDKLFPLKPSEDRRRWELAGESPLASVTQPVAFRIEAEDEDGLVPRAPILGYIRLKIDRPPQISGSIVTSAVVPAARPKIAIRASDDFGISAIQARVTVERTVGDDSDSASASAGDGEEKVVVVRAAGKPVLRESLPLHQDFALDLAPFKLTKGNRVRVTLEAIDYRGQNPGRSGLSDPVTFDVTDEGGVLSAISESDEKSAKQLDAIIKRQLGIGGGGQ